jgi:hypothetical protein
LSKKYPVKVYIKTRKEMGLPEGGRPLVWNCQGEMDYLFGKVKRACVDLEGNTVRVRARKRDDQLKFWSICPEECIVLNLETPKRRKQF